MGVLSSRGRRVALLACSCAALAAIACGARQVVSGTVVKVDPEHSMVLIEHTDAGELLPAGETGFFVANPRILDGLEPGQVGRVVFDDVDGGLVLRDFGLERYATREEGWVELDGVRVRTEPAPPLQLTSEAGQPFGLDDLAGRAVLLGFIYTHCPGPCPIQTSEHMAVRRGLDDDVAARTAFVMVTLDPARDDPAALREYREAHGVDYDNWTFLTGSVEEVEASNRRWGVSATFNPDGTIDHIPIVYLLDGEGRIVRRYMGSGHDPEAMIRDMTQVVRAIGSTPAG